MYFEDRLRPEAGCAQTCCNAPHNGVAVDRDRFAPVRPWFEDRPRERRETGDAQPNLLEHPRAGRQAPSILAPWNGLPLHPAADPIGGLDQGLQDEFLREDLTHLWGAAAPGGVLAPQPGSEPGAGVDTYEWLREYVPYTDIHAGFAGPDSMSFWDCGREAADCRDAAERRWRRCMDAARRNAWRQARSREEQRRIRQEQSTLCTSALAARYRACAASRDECERTGSWNNEFYP